MPDWQRELPVTAHASYKDTWVTCQFREDTLSGSCVWHIMSTCTVLGHFYSALSRIDPVSKGKRDSQCQKYAGAAELCSYHSGHYDEYEHDS